MGRRVTLDLSADTDGMLTELSHLLGFSRQQAAVYAVRLVSACVREGLLSDLPARAWPQEAQQLTGACGKVIDFSLREKSAAGVSDTYIP